MTDEKKLQKPEQAPSTEYIKEGYQPQGDKPSKLTPPGVGSGAVKPIPSQGEKAPKK